MTTPRTHRARARLPKPKAAARHFRYSDQQWEQLKDIVKGAGGVVARDKFNALRSDFEKMIKGWNDRILKWNGRNFGHDETHLYRRIEHAARELKAALADLNFPAIFVGNELVWKGLAEMPLAEAMALSSVPAHLADAVAFGGKAFSDTRENEERFATFCKALEHVAGRAAHMAKPQRKQDRLMRDRFFVALWQVWVGELGLPVSSKTHLSPLVAFIEAAAEGVDVFPKEDTAAYTISNVIRKWPVVKIAVTK